MEKAAVAFAAVHSDSIFILTDSQGVHRNDMKGQRAPLANEILIQSKEKAAWKQLLWVPPGHQGTVGGGQAQTFLPQLSPFLKDAPNVYEQPTSQTLYTEILQHPNLYRHTLPKQPEGLIRQRKSG